MSDARNLPHAALEIIKPEGWAAPRGYSDAIVATGRYVVLAGQIGWDPRTCTIESDDFVAQTAQALRNVVALLAAAGVEPRHLVRLTWYITDREMYVSSRKEIGSFYREIIGSHYPAMSVVVVAGLIEERALVEVEATAVVPE